MRLGELDLKLVSDGGFRLDGGAMFGVVPRTLWERVKPPDERNRIQMTTNCPLVARGGELVQVDSGIGDKNDAKFRAIFGLETGARRLPEAVRAASQTPLELLGVEDRGRLAVGQRADLVELDDALAVRGVWLAGRRLDA